MESIVIFGMLLSLAQSMLFWNKKPGISVLVFTILGIITLIYFMKKERVIENKKALFITIPIILLSITYFIFNNYFINIINIFIIMLLTIIMCIYTIKVKVKMPRMITNIIELIIGALESIEDIFKALKLNKKENSEKNHKIKKVIKSILISLPIILIVLFLLISADTIFAQIFSNITKYLNRIFSIEWISSNLWRLITIIFIGLYFSGFIFNLVKDNTAFNRRKEEKELKINIESTTINIMITTLNIIYLIFSIIQFTSLFTHVSNSKNFDYAEYARQGFFQLMIVSIINLVIIILANKNKQKGSKNQSKYIDIMSIITIIFTIIIIISAFYRMYLYEQEYGYTYLRLFVYYILATELILMIPIILWIIGQKIDLLKSSILICTTMYIILNYSNIDYTIAKKNIDKYFENQTENEIDISYLFTATGTDAISQIKRLENSENIKIKEQVKYYLERHKNALNSEKMSWQELNLSKIIAREKLKRRKLA